ncbi:MAG: SGNH/GDSL hydrolase family protein [Luteimonas sp.]
MTTPRRYLALGDSYTIGEGIAAEDRWPVQLADALRSEDLALDAPEIIATTGWTTDELDAAIDAAAPAGPFDLVSLLIGVNDQYRGRDVALYGPAFSALLDRATGFAGGDVARVFVLAIPDWGVTPFGAHSGRDVSAIARELDAYNAAAAAICAARGVAFVDIAAVSRAHGGEAEMLADDGLHPSAVLHSEWMQLALPVARGLLSRA